MTTKNKEQIVNKILDAMKDADLNAFEGIGVLETIKTVLVLIILEESHERKHRTLNSPVESYLSLLLRRYEVLETLFLPC